MLEMKKERKCISIQLAIETTERALPIALKVMGRYADKLGWELKIAKTNSIAKNREKVLEVSIKPKNKLSPVELKDSFNEINNSAISGVNPIKFTVS